MKWLVACQLLLISISYISAQDVKAPRSIHLENFIELIQGPPIESGEISRAINTEWITQKLDQFNPDDDRTWQMRYFINDEYYKPGGPMFIYVGGEWTIKPASISRGHFVDMAKKFNAILFYTEHRFYGESLPFEKHTTENFKYLSIEQALADLAYFIEYQRENNPDLEDAKVILSGCSYSATMVTWFRRLYPALVDGGWASSGPLLAKVDFREYIETVGKSIKKLGGEQCYNYIQEATTKIQDMVDQGRVAELKSMFKICDDMDFENDMDLWNFISNVGSSFSSVCQYQINDDVVKECKSMMAQDSDPLHGFSKFVLKLWLEPNDTCVDLTYKTTRDAYIKSNGEGKAWFYQTCKEFGWYQTTSSKNQPFRLTYPPTFEINLCNDVFGDEFSNSSIHQNAANTNAKFGGYDPGVSRVYSVHGGLDPWSTMGLQAADGGVFIPDASHCTDSKSISANDSPEALASKKRIEQLIEEWLRR